jgi:glycosyltransferase involved in cell wall biosynthesis
VAQIQPKKKILYVITKASWGGAGMYVYDLATNLDTKSFDVSVALGAEGTLKDLLEDKGIKTHPVESLKRDFSLFLDLVSFWRLFKLFRKERPHIVHLNSSKIGGVGSLAGRLARVPKIIFTVHGWPFNEDRRWIVQIFIRMFSYLTAVFCHKLIVISKKDHKQALSFPFVKYKFILIPNGIKHPNFLPRDQARRLLLQETNLSEIDTEKMWLGMVGELHRNKGHIYAIKAVEILRDSGTNVALIIVGEGEERLSLEQHVREKKLGDHVFIPGNTFDNVGPNKGSVLMKAFDIYILPSLKEGLPYTVLEAGDARLPVIATSVGGIPDIIEDMHSGMLVRKKNAKEIADAISYLAREPEKRQQFGDYLNNTVSSNFSLYSMISKTSELYNEYSGVIDYR